MQNDDNINSRDTFEWIICSARSEIRNAHFSHFSTRAPSSSSLKAWQFPPRERRVEDRRMSAKRDERDPRIRKSASHRSKDLRIYLKIYEIVDLQRFMKSQICGAIYEWIIWIQSISLSSHRSVDLEISKNQYILLLEDLNIIKYELDIYIIRKVIRNFS